MRKMVNENISIADDKARNTTNNKGKMPKHLKKGMTALFLALLIVLMPISFALTITNVSSTAEQDSAAVSWQTDDAASGIVNYGLTKSLGQSSSHGGFTSNHIVNLIGLEDGRKYYFNVKSVDVLGEENIDNNQGNYYSFTTKDTTPPARVTGLAEDESGIDYIKIKWDNTDADDFLKYIIYRDEINIANTTLAKYTDYALNADTAYQYKAAAVDISGNIGMASSVKEIRTLIPDYKEPVISEIAVAELKSSYAKIRWLTDEDSSTAVYYGLNANVENKIEKNESVKEHLVELKDLLNDTPYYYKVISCDAGNNCAESSMLNFRTGEDTEPPFINAELPDWYNSNRLEIIGKTEAFARVRVYINGQLKRAVNTDADGSFRFSGVSLDTKLLSNVIRIVAIDQVGFENYIEKEVMIDTEPPIINVTKLGRYSHEENIILEGYVNEEVTLDINVVQGSVKKEFLPGVTGLRVVNQEANSVELEWDEIEDDNLGGYIIYRNGKRMTDYTDNYFIDAVLNKNTQYTYAIAAYSHKCVEAGLSEPITITTPADTVEIDDSFEELTEYCSVSESGYKPMLVSGRFSQGIKLQQGKNLVIVNAIDKAGNSVIIEQETIVDTEKPVILQHNLNSLSPSYIQHITVRGKVSKKEEQDVIVTVYVNDEPYSELANEDGSFSVDIKLERKFREEMHEDVDYDPERRTSNYYSSYGEGYGAVWNNNIRIIATAESGLESDPIEDGIVLASCGYGAWWSIQLENPTPTMLTPRLMLEGLAQIGIPVMNIKWQGGSRNGSLNYVDVTDNVPLSDKDLERYDLDWVQNVDYIESPDSSKGYVLITLKKLDSGSLFIDSDEAKEGRSEDELTTLEMENYLSEHRLKENDCIVPGFGCIRIPLMMEIDFAYLNGSTYLSYDRREIEMTKQKQCWDVEIPIDRRLPSDKIPEEFLRASINLLTETINAINQLLKPLNTIKQVLFYGCAGSIILDYTMAFQESFNCEFSEALNKFNREEGEKFQKYYAETGQCAIYEGEQKNVCDNCEQAIRTRKNFEKTMKLVCDRIFCPSAPTFQKYVKDISESSPVAADNVKNLKEDEKQVVSDCAYEKNKYREYIKYEGRDGGLKQIYEDYTNQKESEENECAELHEPDTDCCGYEYMQEWNSACMIMDELKESKCVALEDDPKRTVNDDSDCGTMRKVWNSLAGFCEPDGSAPAEIVRTGDKFRKIGDDEADDDELQFYTIDAEKKAVWFRFLPEHHEERLLSGEGRGKIYYAEIGYIDDNIESKVIDWKKGDPSRVSTTRVFQPLTKYDVFPVDVTTTNQDSGDYNEPARDEFVKKYTQAIGAKDNTKNKRAERVYKYLQETIGVSEKEYIVDPTSGILRSFQCVCLPGITSYLNLWKKVLEAVKVCFQTVLVTGDGSTGICKAVLSVYVCDLIYDLISCFKQKYSTGYKREYSGGIGNFFAALTHAGESVSNRVANRYGDSPVYRAIFAEKKLVHSACLWAFTGTWDFDVTAVLEEDVSIDVNTVALLYPCTRRFISFSPASNPSGLTTYNYHLGVGIVSGSKMNYFVELVCSDDYSCDTPTGQCDCVSIGKQTRHMVVGKGTAYRGEVIEEEVYENIMNWPFRYDKAILQWSSSDSDKSGVVECSIKDAGGKPPAFCQLDIAEGRFRCELGFDEESYIRFYSEPIPDQNVYYPEEYIRIDLRVTQRQPKEVLEKYGGREHNPYTKYLVMELYNENRVLLKEFGPYNFNGDGMHEIDDLPGYKINEGDFSRKKAQITATGPISSIKLLDENKPPVYPNVEIEIIDDKGNYKVYEYTNIYEYINNKKGDEITELKKEEITELKNIVKDGNVIFNDGYMITLSGKPRIKDKIQVEYKTAAISEDTCTTELKKWKLHITFYDKSRDVDEQSDQVSNYMGEPQKRVVDIPVRCEKPVDTSLKVCIPDEKVTGRCLCIDKICQPKKDVDVYCRHVGREGSCEEKPKQEVR